MIAIIFIAMAAGCASALMFASIVSGALISVLLFYLAPLPLMVAALGWGPLCATIGGIAAAIGLGAIFGLPYCIAFAIAVALPSWWLGHLALLGRPAGADANMPHSSETAAPPLPALEWYPVGHLLLWITGLAALTTMATLLTLGTDAGAITNSLRASLVQILTPPDTPLPEQTGRWIEILVTVAPSAAALIAMMTLTLNLWLAAKITATSGRLHRPWPVLKNIALPPMTLVALSVAIAICFTGGLVAMLAQIATATLMLAYALIGFAVLHTLTMAFRGRAFWLSCTYAIVAVFVWPSIAMIALGLADAIFGFRQRYLRGRKPPPLPVS